MNHPIAAPFSFRLAPAQRAGRSGIVLQTATTRLLRCTVSIALFSGMALMAAPHAHGQESTAIDVEAEQQEAAATTNAQVERLQLYGTGSETPLDAPADSILKWSNPDVGRVYGNVYLWTRQGRPVVAASIYQWFHPYQSLSIELASLSEKPVRGRHDDRQVWDARTSGVTWRKLPGDAPAGSRTLRLIQMKRAVSRFAATLVDERTDLQGVNRVLRPLATPIYRYPEGATPIDGAVFAFVVGTDPELLLVIEAADDAWRYGLARMNRDALSVALDDAEVESYPHLDDLYDSSRPYVLIDVQPGSINPAGQTSGEAQ